jgi:hypothetical protein
MSWLFSQALVAEYLGANCSDGEQSVQLSGNPTQLAYCAPDKMTAFSRLSRFGMTFKPLTEDRGAELLTLYLAGFHAKTLAQQGEAKAWTERAAECGTTWRGWLARYDPATSLWRTAQCSLLEEEQESLQTLPRWGMTVGGLLWELPMLEQTIKETGSGSLEKWPTPQSSDCRDRGNMSNPAIQRRVQKGKQLNLSMVVHPTSGKLNPTWVEWLMGWPLGWTDLKPLETDKSHCVQQQHGIS